MLTENQPAYVLHVRAWRETSLLLECLTRDHGRVGMVARGARKPRARLSQSTLQPFQPLVMTFAIRGELATLRSAEAAGKPVALQDLAMFSGMYVNELLVRLTGRQDPCPAIHAAYGQVLAALADGHDMGWALRRFERDMLQELGYALQLDHEADSGRPLDPAVAYRYLPGDGPVVAGNDQTGTVLGRDLMALATDQRPDGDGLRRLRVLSRQVLLHHLGGMPLSSWKLLGGMPRSA